MTDQEILFRGFHPCEDGGMTIYVDGKAVKGKWVEGVPLQTDSMWWICTDTEIYNNGGVKRGQYTLSAFCFEVLPSTVGQYTGKDDKNGRKIFKGDIVRFISEYLAFEKIGSVNFGEYGAAGDTEKYNIGYYFIWNDATDNYHRKELGYWIAEYGGEVIGTIFDKEGNA